MNIYYSILLIITLFKQRLRQELAQLQLKSTEDLKKIGDP